MMAQHWRMSANGSGGNKGGHEVNFATTEHKRTNKDCEGKQNGAKKGNVNAAKKGVCFVCGKEGHFAAECWDNPENADKRPTWWKPKPKGESGGNEVNDAAKGKGKSNTGGGNYKLLFCNVDKQLFPDVLALLTHPSAWITDTAATSNMTFDDRFMH
jgi:hypothetical protein